jgi:hypothetical protein
MGGIPYPKLLHGTHHIGTDRAPRRVELRRERTEG